MIVNFFCVAPSQVLQAHIHKQKQRSIKCVLMLLTNKQMMCRPSPGPAARLLKAGDVLKSIRQDAFSPACRRLMMCTKRQANDVNKKQSSPHCSRYCPVTCTFDPVGSLSLNHTSCMQYRSSTCLLWSPSLYSFTVFVLIPVIYAVVVTLDANSSSSYMRIER